jgi:Putative 2OG-Fe(II) oxygenase
VYLIKLRGSYSGNTLAFQANAESSILLPRSTISIQMNNIFSCNFPNYGFVGCTLTDEQLAPIVKEVNDILNNLDLATSRYTANTLVGHIVKEYKLIDSADHLESLVNPLIKVYQQSFGSVNNNLLNKDFKLHKAWINFQKKYEFNPLHRHTGDYSFVLYIKIPYTMKDENSYFSHLTESANKAGTFSFQFTNTLGQISSWNIPTDSSYEKRLILFPAEMNHEVHPFYSSDEYRISISGNMISDKE